MSNWILSAILGLSLFPIRASENGKPSSIVRGWASRDCSCQDQIFDESPVFYTAKKGALVGEACEARGAEVVCEAGFARRITCPKDCLQLRRQGPLSRDEWRSSVADFVAKSAHAEYAKFVPAAVLKEIQKMHPDWQPVIYSEKAPFVADFRLMRNFYFEVPLSLMGETTSVSIVYYFQDLDHLLERNMNWSFWRTLTGKLLYDGVAPYKVFEHGYYVQSPCLAPAGRNLEEVLLSGHSRGPSDASGCCGLYSLRQLVDKGPVMIDDQKEIYDGDVVYYLCGNSTDRTGKYAPENIHEIHGPASIRKKDGSVSSPGLKPEHPAKSEVIGQCADRSRVAVMGSNGDWHYVYCDGKSGWTHKSNIRWPTK